MSKEDAETFLEYQGNDEQKENANDEHWDIIRKHWVYTVENAAAKLNLLVTDNFENYVEQMTVKKFKVQR
jgi:hypothetical protein